MALKKAYLIIDLGTGNMRVAVAESNGTILGVERGEAKYERDTLYPESIYFSPDEWWQQILELTQKVLKQVGPVEIVAITATSQREGIVVLDQAGNSLLGMPNIDHRGREWEEMIPDKTEVYRLTGRYPTSLFSALKLVGLKNRRPDVWESVHTFTSISDWAQFKFSGVVGYEHSQASETLLYDVAGKKWSDRLLDIFKLDQQLLPPLQNSGTVLGGILPEVAQSLGISENAQVMVGGSDTQLAIMSMCPSVQDVVIVSGTTTPIIKIADHYILDEQQRTWTSRHTDASSFLLEANAGVTGLNYQRLKEIFYPHESYEVMEAEVAAVEDASCVAALGSLLADEKSPLLRGGFIFPTPVSHQLTRGHFVFATLWDIACSIFENYKSLDKVSTHHEDYVKACGGGVQSKILRQFLANLFGKKVIVLDNFRQASVVGGIFVCNLALGIPNQQPGVLEEVLPDASGAHQLWYEQWKANRETFKSAGL